MAGDGTLYAIDADSGTKRWSTTTPWPYPSSLVVANGFVYVAADAALFVFNATTGASLWSDNPGGDVTTMVPAVANGVIYTTPRGSAYHLYAHDATTGKVLWSADRSDSGGGSSPAVANGVAYVSDPGAWIGAPRAAFRVRTRRNPPRAGHILVTCRSRVADARRLRWRTASCTTVPMTAHCPRSTPAPARASGRHRPDRPLHRLQWSRTASCTWATPTETSMGSASPPAPSCGRPPPRQRARRRIGVADRSERVAGGR